MKFLKTFYQLHENEDASLYLFYLYPKYDEWYGSALVKGADELDLSDVDLEPGYFMGNSSEGDVKDLPGYNEEEEKEVLASQTGGVYDENYEYDFEDDEYLDWRQEIVDNYLEESSQSDLWGQVWICLGDARQRNYFLKAVGKIQYRKERMPTLEEAEKDFFGPQGDGEGIKAWMRVCNANDANASELAQEGLDEIVVREIERDPVNALAFIPHLSPDQRQRAERELDKIAPGYLKTLMISHNIGLF